MNLQPTTTRESIGALENSHKSLNAYFRAFCSNSNWDDWIRYFVFYYNTNVHTSHGYTPYELVYGHLCASPTHLWENELQPLYNIDNYAKELKYKIQQSSLLARKLIIQKKEKRKLDLDRKRKARSFKVGDLVLLRNDAGSKLENVYEGPFEVVDINEPNCIILYKQNLVEVHMDRLKYV